MGDAGRVAGTQERHRLRLPQLLEALRGPKREAMLDELSSRSVWQTRDRAWVVTGFQAGVDLLSSDAVASSSPDDDERARARILLAMDGPEHLRLRRHVTRGVDDVTLDLSPAVEAALARSVRRAARGEGDLATDFVAPVAAEAVRQVVGLPADDGAPIVEWARLISDALDPLAAPEASEPAMQASLAAMRFIKRVADDGAGTGGVLAQLTAAKEGGALTEREQISMGVSLISAGLDTTQGLLGSAIVVLARHAELRDAVVADRELLHCLIEEVCRIESPVQLTTRFVLTEDAPGLPGSRPGQLVIVSFACTNRDPARYGEPARFQLGWDRTEHLGFGWGIHRCVGAGLARTTAMSALGSLLEHCDLDRVRWASAVLRPHSIFRSYDRLPLTG